MNKPKFLRRTWGRYPKLGKKRKKKQIWRRPTGRDNKMREKRKGYPSIVSIGYKSPKKERKKIFVIRNVNDLKKVSKDQIVIVGNVGNKKRMDILKKAKEDKIDLTNLNEKKFIKEIEKKSKKKKDSKKIEKSTNVKTTKEDKIKEIKKEDLKAQNKGDKK